MYYLVIGRDGKDDQAFARRMSVRAQHLALAEQNYQTKKLLYATAILDDAEKMVGSVLIFNLANQTELDHYLKTEPYITGKVWEELEVTRCQPGAFFLAAEK